MVVFHTHFGRDELPKIANRNTGSGRDFLNELAVRCENASVEAEEAVLCEVVDAISDLVSYYVDITWRNRAECFRGLIKHGAAESGILKLFPENAEIAFSCVLPSRSLTAKVQLAGATSGFSQGGASLSLSLMGAFLRSLAALCAKEDLI